MEGCQSQRRTRNGLSNQGLKHKRSRSFRTVARQVMIANSFTRRTHANLSSGHTLSSSSRISAVSTTDVGAKRGRPQMTFKTNRQSAELFPMSTEMKETLASLGKMHFLPELDQKKRKVLTVSDEGSKRISTKFRDKTRQKLIQPQRFIRNLRSTIVQAKDKSDHKEHESTSSASNPSVAEDCESVELNETEVKPCVHEFIPKSYAWSEDKPDKTGTANSPGRPWSRNRRDSNLDHHYDLRGTASDRTDVWKIGANAKRLLLSRKRVAATTKNGRGNEMIKDGDEAEASLKSDISTPDGVRASSPPNWESVEELTTGIQQKCRKWLEIRYGHIN